MSLLPIEQEVFRGKEIFPEIESAFKNAFSEILIATAWFTDDVLFDVLLAKCIQGVKVEIILADKIDNQKLDFNQLINAGAVVIRMKNSGYGMMHHKFCVVDKKVVLFGSYNLTNNAKNNNDESIIKTNHQGTIDQLIKEFENLKSGKIEDAEDIKLEDALPSGHKSEFEKVLDSMISAEIGNYDRSLLKRQGYENSKANNGDQNMILKAIDNIYSAFIADIDVVDDKKKRLISKMEAQKAKEVDTIKNEFLIQRNAIESKAEINTQNCASEATKSKEHLDINRRAIEGIKKDEIVRIEEQIASINKHINEIQTDFVKPAFRWFEFIPRSILLFFLISYLILFYSSAAYILMFLVLDTKEALLQGITPTPAEAFDPWAISKAINRGGTSVLFIILFVSLPLSFSIIKHIFQGKKWMLFWIAALGIVIIDLTTAYKVTQAIYESDLLRGAETENWRWFKLFSNTNFYLVFVLGSFGLLMFSLTFNSWIRFFEERNPDLAFQKSRVLIRQQEEEINTHKSRILELQKNIEDLEKRNIALTYNIESAEMEGQKIPLLKDAELTKIDSLLNEKLAGLNRITDIYISHVESDTLPVSIDSLRDRISVFLRGWSDYLHEEYSIQKAVEKSSLANEAANSWLREKVQSRSIDLRLKLI